MFPLSFCHVCLFENFPALIAARLREDCAVGVFPVNPSLFLKRKKLDFIIIMTLKTDQNGNVRKAFKERKPLESRLEEIKAIKAKFPNKVPIIVEKYHKEVSLPLIDKTKFLVPEELTVSQFLTIIRSRLNIASSQAVYLIINNKNMASLSKMMSEVYRENADKDGFLYVTYASQEMFGCASWVWSN